MSRLGTRCLTRPPLTSHGRALYASKTGSVAMFSSYDQALVDVALLVAVEVDVR